MSSKNSISTNRNRTGCRKRTFRKVESIIFQSHDIQSGRLLSLISSEEHYQKIIPSQTSNPIAENRSPCLTCYLKNSEFSFFLFCQYWKRFEDLHLLRLEGRKVNFCITNIIAKRTGNNHSKCAVKKKTNKNK